MGTQIGDIMAEKITSLTPEDSRLIAVAWLEALPRQMDMYRSIEALQEALAVALWYRGPGRSYLYLTGIAPSHMASFHALNLDGRKALRDLRAIRQTIKEIMEENELVRLHSTFPTSLTKVRKACKDLGFRHEGTLRKFGYFDGQLVDVHTMSILFEEFDVEPPKRRRRRRSRRKKNCPQINEATKTS